MPSSFRDLNAYKLAVALAADVYLVVGRWSEFDRATVGEQLVRSIDSVGANIAEATGRWSKQDKRRVLLIARGELHEAEHWLAVAEARGLIKTNPSERVAEVARTLNGLIKQPTRR